MQAPTVQGLHPVYLLKHKYTGRFGMSAQGDGNLRGWCLPGRCLMETGPGLTG